MKTFPGWRDVGRAMRWARQQDGVTVRPTACGNVIHSRRYGGHGGTAVYVTCAPGATWIKAVGPYCSTRISPLTADQALRVLAALDLIPAELAEPRPVVTVGHRVIMAFINAPDEPDGDIGGPLRAAFRAAGLTVADGGGAL